MEEEIRELNSKIALIEERNKRVEIDKKWETSKARILIICIITYVIASLYMQIANTKSIYFAAIVPVIGFYLSTMTVNFVKKLWLKNNS